MRHAVAQLGRRLVLTQSLIDELAQQIVFDPGEIFDLGDQFGPHPMHAAQHQRRSGASRARSSVARVRLATTRKRAYQIDTQAAGDR
jgi:hypothetical protein